LTCHPSDFDDRHARAVLQDRSHLQDGLDSISDRVCRRCFESLSAIATLQPERLALLRQRDPRLESICLAREDEWR
jgi:hypothetical protein